MAYEQSIREPATQLESDDDVSLKPNWRSISSLMTAEKTNESFECNICLDAAQEPVVTLCGHLYCWPCIYKWFHVQRSSPQLEEEPKCPVCKADTSQSSLVPLYGRGTSPSESNAKKPELDLVIPRRPTAVGTRTLTTAATSMNLQPNQRLPSYPVQSRSQPIHHQEYFPYPYGSYASPASSNFGGTTTASFFSPTIGMFGETVFTRMFGSPDTSLFSYPSSSTHHFAGNGRLRMRRQEMQVDKSLNRVSIFLLCCFILCLLLF